MILRMNGRSKLKLKYVCIAVHCVKVSTYIDGDLCIGEIEKCNCKVKNIKTRGSYSLVGELLKYGKVTSAF